MSKKIHLSSKRRLVLTLSTFPQQSETFIVSKFLGLLSRGLDVHILCSKFNRKAWAFFSELAANPSIKKRVHTTPPHQPKWLAVILFPIALLTCFVTAPRETWRYLKSGWSLFRWDVWKHFYLDAPLLLLRPDILHFEFGSLAVGRTFLKTIFNTKMSASFRGYDLNFVGLDKPDHYHPLWQGLDGCHLLSNHLWNRALERGCPKDMNHHIIPPAIDLDTFHDQKATQSRQVGTQNQPLRILSVGRLEWKKGYEHALAAVRLLLDQNIFFEYHIIGSGQYVAALHYARYQLGLDNYVRFLGSQSHERVIECLKWADVFLHPSLSEGFCNAVLEAQAIGLPVVCSDAGGLPENIQDGVTGFIVPRRNPKAMAEKLAFLANDGQLRKQMGAAGRLRVETHFRLEQQLDAFEDFYAQL